MAIRRGPDDPLEGLPGELLAYSLRLFEQMRHDAGGDETEFPSVDIYETPSELIVEAELPGVDPARVSVTASEGIVVIEGTKEENIDEGRVNFLCMERSFGDFRRVVPLGRAVDISRVRATCRDGLLQIRIPRVKEKRGRQREIPVTSGEPDTEGRETP